MSIDDGPRSPRMALPVVVILLLIVYGSLYPFRWAFDAPQAFVWSGPVSLLDVIENVALFLPLGAVLGWSSHRHARRAARFVAWAAVALAVASGLQWLQRYLPSRTPALSDVVCNGVGYVLGWAGGVGSRQRLGDLAAAHRPLHRVDRVAIVLVALWLLAELFPLIPTLDLSSLKENLKSLWLQPAWQPRRMAVHLAVTVLGLAAVAEALRSAGFAQRARHAALLAAAAVLAGKFVVAGQVPGVAMVAGIAAGALLWRLLDGAPRRAAVSTAAVALVAYLIDALWPWALRAPVPMAWLPFASALSTSIQASLASRAFECLCFGAVVWSALRLGIAPGPVTAATALLAFACEWTQRWLPTRTPEITPALLALAMGWLAAAWAAQRRIARTSSSTGNSPTATIATDGNAASARRSSRARL